MNQVYQAARVSRQAYYQYNQRQALFNDRLYALCIEADMLREEHPGCGVEKMYTVLKPDWLGRDRFIEIMMHYGYRLRVHRNYSKTTYPGKVHYPNMIPGMLLWDKNLLWQSDITYYRIADTFYYLIFIIDAYTKRILGYSATDHMRATANLTALKMAIVNAGTLTYRLIHHSDRGSQYGEKNYVELLNKYRINISMCKHPQDNAYAERINGIIKNEYLKYWDISNLTMLKKKCKQAVNHYNTKRPHLYLPNKNTPLEFERSLVNLNMIDRHLEIVYSSDKPSSKRPKSEAYLRPYDIADGSICPIFKSNE